MKIFCCSDTHGKAPPLYQEANLFLHAGDFYNRLGPAGKAKGISYKDYINVVNKQAELEEWHKSRNQQMYSVKGNHDVEDPFNLLGFSDLTWGVERISKDILLIGIGWAGCVYFELPTEQIMQANVQTLKRQIALKSNTGDKFLVLTHYPPYFADLYEKSNQNPDGWMFKCIAELCEELKPVAVIQGHVHELFGLAIERKGSIILAPGPKGMILDLSGSTPNVDLPSI